MTIRSFLVLIASSSFGPFSTDALGESRVIARDGSNLENDGAHEPTSLIQLTAFERRQEACTDLLNKGTHFAVNVKVGTPPQNFELVADTGSDAVIVTSCVCVDQGYCHPQDKCFRGTNHSSTFAVSNHLGGKPAHGPMGVAMTFGSGSVTSVIASDTVEVAGVKAHMKDGLLLMVDRRALNIGGPFEGIFGLGPPHNATLHKQMHPDLVQNDEEESVWHPPRPSWAPVRPKKGPSYAPKLFSTQAKVERFSICFNDADKPGTLRLNSPAFAKPLPSIGKVHWGLGLFGISVGSHSSSSHSSPSHSSSLTKAVLCDGTDMKPGQKTPCGAIPDSGTTLLMGPKHHIEVLFGSICDNWERCRNARKDKMKHLSASHAFQTLIMDCGSWMTDHDSIDEVPSIFLTVGAPGKEQKIELTAWSYITETMQPVYHQVVKYLFGVLPVKMNKPTSKLQKVCTPSFGVQDYNTLENGPVWILGTPIFYQYTVGYSLSGPSISFLSEKCQNCNLPKSSLLSSQNEISPVQTKGARRMRTVNSPPLVPYFDTSLPL